MIYNLIMSSRKWIKSEPVMFRASKPLVQAIRKAAARQHRTVADWVRTTIEAALSKTLANDPDSSWAKRLEGLTAEGRVIQGTRRKSSRLLDPPPGPGPAGVLDALLEERRSGR
jgi:hypothetical protein